MGLRVTVQPLEEPVTLGEVKLFLKVDHSDEDTFISSLIKAARINAQDELNRIFISQTLEYSRDEIPTDNYVELPVSNATSIATIKYIDANEVLQTLSADNYELDLISEPGRIHFINRPSLHSNRLNALQITFIAGFENQAAVTEDIKTGLKLLIAHYYENRSHGKEIPKFIMSVFPEPIHFF